MLDPLALGLRQLADLGSPGVGERKAPLERIRGIEAQRLGAVDPGLAGQVRQDRGPAADRGLADQLDQEFAADDRARAARVADLRLAARMQDREIGGAAGAAGRSIDPPGLQSGAGPDGAVAVAAAEHDIGDLVDAGQFRMLHMHFEFLERTLGSAMLTGEHDEMLAAIAARDADRADALAHAHTRQFRDNFIRFMGETYVGAAPLAAARGAA